MNSTADESKALEKEVIRFFANIDAATLREDLIEYFLMYIRIHHSELPMAFDNIGERFYDFTCLLKQIDARNPIN